MLPAVICGIVALGQKRGGGRSGRGMAIAGLLISAAWLLLIGLFITNLAIVWRDTGVG